MRMHPDEDILYRGHILEQADVLICAGDAHVSHPVWRETGDIFAIQQDFTFFRVIEPGNTVEECGLACSIRSNNAMDGVFLDVEVDLAQCLESAKALGDFISNANAHSLFSFK